ncbi:DUF4912 domain-containing protein [Thalassoglobus sp.]|uniref:DUF4912 domain-containing protein n=1 Tax=Thalassoglobus sp. TaxID=2795869 RepID=UPI003AA88BE5
MSHEERPQEAERLRKPDQISDLSSLTVPELRELAKSKKISGAGRLRKNELINELLAVGGTEKSRPDEEAADWLQVENFGPYWLGIEWHVSQKLQKRAAAALGRDWHRVQKVLRIYRVDWGDSGPHAREHTEDLEIPEQASRWFVQIDTQSSGWKIELGYLAPGGKFFSLLQSAAIEVASLRKGDSGVPLGASDPQPRSASRFTKPDRLFLAIEGEVSVNGTTHPGANVSVDDQTVQVHSRLGQFQRRSPLLDGRLFLPIVAEYGNQRLRAVVSIETNIHYLEAEKTSSDL